MPKTMNSESFNGPQQELLSIYLLHSLKKKPKSGYDLLSEIKEKTGGTWVPSKGTLYPLLKHLEQKEFIKIKMKDIRSKNIFQITPTGKKMIAKAKKQGENMMKKGMRYGNLIIDIMGEDSETHSIMMQIQQILFLISKEKKNEVIKILRRCASDLKKEVC
jgi:DNA-binding PadR family transcriptional regulator